MTGACIALLTLAIQAFPKYWVFEYPPKSNPMIDILSQEVKQPLGSEFRGRVADMLGRSIERNVLSAPDIFALAASLVQTTGNDFRLMGLHYFGIPGFFQFNETISPFLYVTSTRLLAFPEDKQRRNVMVLRKIDTRILAMLGVRFVITDRVYDGVGATLSARMRAGEHDLFLYEIGNPNVGDYSPSTVVAIPSASGIVMRMANPNFDPKHEVIADIPIEANGLVPANNARLTFKGGALQLQAESHGQSILLVPLEFSRCLDATPVKYEKPVIFRANLLETGVLFSERVDAILSIRTGAFFNPACRLRDFFDARTLNVTSGPITVGPTQTN